ncbi:hypothetical protein N7481_013035 [Penicillium waksmanii]|uniref:uncharacterized protein n=1 Tax=Penicillium waksmanii TaxID=69791 RepID=UPI002548ED7C|nr:uncharacterized protein N7481_013035 [Penicillium waksmanii]KAJ5966321.1 hypothetical protein N7481_013035 [Penicillium waksmanii]
MSNSQPPPSYGGHPSYAQWPPPYPGMMPPNIPPGQYPPPIPPPLANTGQPFPYHMGGFDPNATIPMPPNGAPTGPGIFYPPPFPFMQPLDPSQMPAQSFPPTPMPPLGYPQFPAPPGSSQPAPGPWDAHSADTSRAQISQSQTRATSYTNSNREDGEVGDEETSPAYRVTEASRPARGPGLVQASSVPHDDLEEGEALSSRSSSRSSSPYNPPLSVSADPDVVNRAIEMQKREVTTATSEDSQPSIPAAQLRVQAQGALLSLAPHNIRYNELVAEGINPALLKQLYEDIGIKVAAPQPEKKAAPITLPSEPSNAPKTKDLAPQPTPAVKPTELVVLDSAEVKSKKPAIKVSQKPATNTSPPSSTKPMERKEVIARMLAAKAAARASEPKVSPKVTPTPTPPAAPAAKTNGAGRQALTKREEKNQQFSQAPSDPAQSDELSEGVAPAVQHPLPVRPPPPSSDPAKLPGLLLTGSDPENGLPSTLPASQVIAVDSTPVSRAAQRKRPRASDFDEPANLPKKPFSYSAAPSDSESKLIIDISEDESLYGDDEGANMDVDSSPEQESAPAPSLDAIKPALSRNSSTGRMSSSTLQGHDQESIRERDLQIQAMHRRIAELERKRKEKLAASRTQSPLPLGDSTVSSSGQSSAASADIPETPSALAAPASGSKLAPTTCTHISTLVDRPDLINTFSESSIRVLASMDIAQLDSIRSKILRMKEIESGLPELDNEIESSEQRLAACREEANILLAEITKGKEGRILLVDELKRLSDEIDGLTLEDLDELRRQAEIKEQHLATKEASPVATVSADAKSSPVPSAHVLPNAEAVTNMPDAQVNRTAQIDDMEDVQGEASPSESNSGGSAMDESDDSDSFEETPSVQEEAPVASPPADAEPVLEAAAEASIDHSNTSVQPKKPSNLDGKRRRNQKIMSPPEPDTGAESPGSAYSPPLSPAPLAILDGPPNSAPLKEQPLNEVFISAPPPVPAWEPRQITEILGAPGAYRFHPEFLNDVSDGYRSLTYSHDIDSMKMLCPYELAGGVCNDNTCGFQHFRDIIPSDDKILVQMGALREGQTEEEKEKYRTGLKEIINGMRRDKVKDFITVANEIAAYRRRVLQDPSRVLHL